MVSTVGLLSGVAIADVPRATIFLTGIVLIFVEAFSMAVGSFLSETSAAEYSAQKDVAVKYSLFGGVIMFFSYFLSGFVPLFPYIIFETKEAFMLSIGFSLASLFILGLISAKLSNVGIFKRAVRMLLVGGVAIGVGVAVGKIFIGI